MTALCLTKNRRQWLPKAIQCFLSQTYEPRELLIIADGEDVRDLVPVDERIRLIHLAEARSIGEKRNFGCERAHGEIIAHWDEDDYSAPERLADQIKRLIESGKAVTGYHTLRFSDGERWWRYEGVRNYALGTSLVYRLDWWKLHKFRAVHVGEDNAYVEEANRSRQLITADAGELMWASIHPGNTSPRKMTGSNWKRI